MFKNNRKRQRNNIKLTNSFQALATVNEIEDNIDVVYATASHQAANEKDRV